MSKPYLECADCDSAMEPVACLTDGCTLPHYFCPNGCEARAVEA